MLEQIANLPPIVQALIRVLCVVGPILGLVPGLIWLERRLLSWMQDRIGPNISGTITFKSGKKLRTFGLVQPLLDGIKLFLKEDVTPSAIDGFIYFVAPAVALFPAFALGMTLPWGPLDGPMRILHPVADVNIGVLYVLAISSLGVYGIVLAGYSSNNKYSLMGGLRASAQLISYELAMGMAVASVALVTGSLKMTDMVRLQLEPLWGFVPFLPNWNIANPVTLVAAIIFAICIVAETNRAPFDLPEAENELIAGYHTEYSSMKFAVFFMGEYAAMFVFSGVFAALFLGGYSLPFREEGLGGPNGIFHSINYFGAPLWFIAKCALGVVIFIWIRATLPRLRYDQLMSLGWKSLLPLAVANFLIAALWIVATSAYGSMAGWIAFAIAWGIVVLGWTLLSAGNRRSSPVFAKRAVQLVHVPAIVPTNEETA